MNPLLKDLITRNWGFKLLSFFLALVLWMTLVPEEKTYSERTLAVPLETRNIPPNMELVEKSVSFVDVTVRATNRLLGQLTGNETTAVLDLKNATVAQEEYALDPSMVIVPANAKAVRVFPSKARIKLERANEIEMDVTPSTVGKVRDGFKIDKIEALPAKIKVRGPESKFRPKDRLRVGDVDVTDLAETTEFEAALILPRAELRVAAGSAKVRVKVTVSPQKG
jgi:YbbR domain-containing protein